MKTIMDRDYCWEDLNDIPDDLWDCLYSASITGEFSGTLRVTVTYEKGSEVDEEVKD